MKKPKLKTYNISKLSLPKEALITKRDVFFEQSESYIKTPVYKREKLKAGNIIYGPAVIEQYDATTVVYPKWKASVDKFGNLILSIEKFRGKG